MADPLPPPAWFTPRRLLAIFCAVNILLYLDRGLFASNGVNGSPRTPEAPAGSGIQGDFGLTNTQDGLLASAFLVGLLVASPLFSDAAKHASAFRLIGVGMTCWVLAVAGCAAAPGFTAMLAARGLTGVGEASFVALAAPFIDDYAPRGRKARWLACFYLCIPVGFALGYLLGGGLAPLWGWRAAFLAEAALMLPFVAFAFLARPPHLAGSREGPPSADPTAPRSAREAAAELRRDASAVASHSLWRWSCAGYVPYTAVLGAYAFWGPKAGRAIFALDGATADRVFGAVTVATGVGGSLAGGVLLDRLGGTARAAASICSGAAAGGLALALLAFAAARTFGAFVALFAAAELFMFASQAPVAALGMWSVPAQLRPLGISLTTTAIHLLGDVPSPPLVGWLQSALSGPQGGGGGAEGGGAAAGAGGGGGGGGGEGEGKAWRAAMAAVTLLLGVAALAWARAARLAGTPGAPDYNSGGGGGGGGGAGGGGNGGAGDGGGEGQEEAGAAEEGAGAGAAAAAATTTGAAAAEARPLLPGEGGGGSGGSRGLGTRGVVGDREIAT